MPEGDVVWRTARQLDEALSGRALNRSDFRVPRFATTDLAGRVVTGTVSRGKHLLTRVDNGVTIHTHLRMDGSWRIRPASGYLPRDHRIRLVLGNDERQAIGYLLGIVEVVPTRHEERVVGHLGPDLLGPDWDAAEAVRRLQADPGRAVSEALLDQRNLAGIGNLYRAEVLFLRGIDPWRPVGDIGDLPGLVELARQLLDANKDRIDQVTTGSLTPGTQTWVYGRGGRPCRRCGGRIRRVLAAGGSAAGSGASGSDASEGSAARDSATRDSATRDSATRSSAARASAARASAARGSAGRGSASEAERVTFWCARCQPAED